MLCRTMDYWLKIGFQVINHLTAYDQVNVIVILYWLIVGHTELPCFAQGTSAGLGSKIRPYVPEDLHASASQNRGILLTFNYCKAFPWIYIAYLWSALESHSVSTVNTDRSADKKLQIYCMTKDLRKAS